MSYPSAQVDPTAISSKTQFAAGITALREAQGLSVRELARRLDARPGTLGDYFAGRHTPPVTQLALFHALLAECGVTGPDDVAAWTETLRRVRSGTERRAPKPAPPYRGLEAFGEGDADQFFGRTDETADILQRISRLGDDPGPSHRILAVVGPSGSGKSSLLRAGIVAAIRGSRLDENDENDRDATRWTCAVTTPGIDPGKALAESRTRIESAAETGSATRQDSVRQVLVVDQFEELFTSGLLPAQRSAFLAELRATAQRSVVVIGLRADFYAAAAGEPVILPALQHAQVVVGPMTAAHVRDVIERPATDVGYGIERGFVDLVLADLSPRDRSAGAYDAGALPLLSHALLATWERTATSELTTADYLAAGGIDGAIQRTAEELYDSLQPGARELVRRVFLRLVHVDGEIAVTRRRVTHDELDRIDDPDATDALLDAFLQQRLLTADTHTVEISHEALLTAWPRLQDWIDADRAGLRLHRQITEGANAWIDGTRDASLLPRGVRLENSVEWAADPDHAAELAPMEHEYLSAGVAQRDMERRRDRQRTRRLRRLLAAVAALAVLAGALAVYSAHAKSQADDASASARSARDNALSRQVALQSRELQAQDPALAQQLALAAYSIAPTEEASGTVVDASAQPVITRVLGSLGQTAMAQAPGRNIIAVARDSDGSVRLYGRRSGRPPTDLGTVPGDAQRDRVVALAFTPDGDSLATGGAGHTVTIWDVRDPAHPHRVASLPLGPSDAVKAVAIDPSGSHLITVGTGSTPVHAWDISEPSSPRTLPTPRGTPPMSDVRAVATSPDGATVAAGDSDGTVRIWRISSLVSAPTTFSVGSASVFSLLYATPGTLLVGDAGGEIQTWSVATRPRALRTQRMPTNSQVNTMAFSPDRSTLAVGLSDNSVLQYTFPAGALVTSTPNPGPVNSVAYSADGVQLLTTCEDGALRLMPALARPIPVTPTVFNLAYDADGSRLLVVNNRKAGGARLWDTRDRLHPVPVTPQINLVGGTKPAGGSGAVNPAGTLVALGNADGQVQLWDTSVPARPRAWAGPFTAAGDLVESLVFTPDGRYLAVGDDDHTVTLWDVRSPATPRRVSVVRGGDAFLNVDISRSGTLMAAANADSHVYLWNIADPARPALLSSPGGFTNEAYGVAFNRSAGLLAGTGADHTTRVWNITDPRRPVLAYGPLIGPTDYVYTAAFDPRGRYLAVASNDRTVRLYDLSSHQRIPVDTLRAVGSNVFSVAYSPDGSTLVGGGRTSTVTLWDTTPSGYAKTLCSAAGDPITRDEWALYVPGAKYDPPCR